MSKLKWVVGALVAVVVLVTGGTWVYINVIRDDPPEPLAFDSDETAEPSDGSTTSTAPPDPSTDEGAAEQGIEGTWILTAESVVGYRVDEILFGQNATAVGRTNAVEGEMTIVGTTVESASFEVDMATFESDDDRRDNQFRGRIMDAATYPTATLVLTEPITLDQVPDDLEVVEVTAVVDLTLRGTTRSVPIDLRARRNGSTIEIDGATTIVFAEWEIPNPSTGGITTEESGELEFVLVFARS